jgi:hypothetical protein
MLQRNDIQEAGRVTTLQGVAPRVFMLRSSRFLYWWRQG